MVIIYGCNYKDALKNGPVKLTSMAQYRSYKEIYSYVEIISD